MSGLPPELALADVGPRTPLARGGLGTVDALERKLDADLGPLVLKHFHRPDEAGDTALRALTTWRRDLAPADRRRLDLVTTWPLAVVTDGGAPVGFVMRRVPARYGLEVRLPSGRRAHALREAQYLFGSRPRAQRLGIDDVDLDGRRELVYEFAEAVAFLHARGIVIGDVSARNLLWCSSPSAVMLVDCDAMHLPRIGSPHPPAFTVDWDDPAQPLVPAASSDVYKLGLFVLRALGRSFQSRDPALADDALDGMGRWLLRASLDRDPSARPGADAWERWAAGRRAARSVS